MKKVVSGWILLFLGAFLLVAAILMATIGPGLAERTPLNVNSKTYLSGEAKKLNPATGGLDDVPVVAYNLTQADPKKSDGKVVVFVSTACVNVDRGNPPPCLKGDDDRVISNTIETFAADRHTGVAVNDAKYTNPKSEPHKGLVNKFPFGTEKKTYQYWDNTLKQTVDAKYVDSEKVKGVATYKFQIDVPTTKTDIAVNTPGTYANSITIWVEPITGAFIDEKQHQTLVLADGSPVLDLKLAFTPNTVSGFASDAKDNVSKLNLLTKLIPIVAGILGLVALVVGFLMIRGGRGQEEEHQDESVQNDGDTDGADAADAEDAEPSTA